MIDVYQKRARKIIKEYRKHHKGLHIYSFSYYIPPYNEKAALPILNIDGVKILLTEYILSFNDEAIVSAFEKIGYR
jgi:hypothetical protein